MKLPHKDIVDLTSPSKEVKAQVIDTVGKAFGWIKKYKMKGVGSSRLVVSDYSQHFEVFFVDKLNINFSSIELRPKGIIVHFYHRQQHLAWLIPYFRLNYYHTDAHGIYANGMFIRFEKEFLKVRYDKFFRKLTDQHHEFNEIFNGGPNPGTWS